MARPITHDPREYRRGMVLGLTLAETLLLLLFLLLLATAALMWKREQAVMQAEARLGELKASLDHMRPLLEELRRRGPTATTVEALIGRLARGEAAESQVRELQQQRQEALGRARRAEQERNESAATLLRLEQEAAQLRASLSEAQGAARRAEQERDESAATLLRLEQEAAQLRTSLSEAQGAARALSDRAAGLERNLHTAIAEGMIEAGVYPSCWRAGGPDGEAFRIDLHDGGRITVTDTAPAERRAEAPWTRIGPFPRNVEIRMDTFLAAIQPLARWGQSARPQCRFRVRVVDATSANNKADYRRMMGQLGNANNQHTPFYRFGG